MFERFTDGARRAVTDAQVVARRLGHDRLGTVHVRLGRVEGEGVAARVLGGLGVTSAAVEREILAEVGRGPLGSRDAEALGAIGIDLDEVRRRVEASFGKGALHWRPGRRHPAWRPPMLGGHIPFSPRAKKALELSLREALALKHNYIGTEHVLLGIVREGEGLGMLALTRLGAGPQLIRARVLDAFRSTG
ncbi:MAG TPA: Clp protease N-terminal domain-containing protein [Actinomycetes bacterium]|nr:Clp protease N-terminal domain-containing protein [Actinomycetes bacterium]